ncbi:MAG: hypothetical protein K2I96_18925 [Lachnospiraceae bacterium]|nr:hypothetical protein [Lachnospiraceae bacterium]
MKKKMKKIVSAFLLFAMVMASSVSIFAAEEEKFEYDGIVFEIADREVIWGNARDFNALGEALLITGHYGDNSKTCAHAITRTYGKECLLTAKVSCMDIVGNITSSPVASKNYATSVMSGLISPKNSYGGEYFGHHSIMDPDINVVFQKDTYIDLRG